MPLPSPSALTLQGLSITPKSKFVASDLAAAKSIQAALAKEVFKVGIGPVGQDLGSDFVAGARRRVSLQTFRMTKVMTGVSSTIQVGRVTKGAATRRLILTGVRPRVYGFSVLGAAPTTIHNIRTTLVKGLSIKKPGGCATTALATHGYLAKDPLLTMLVENVLGLAEAIQQEGGLTQIHKSAWDTIYCNMPQTYRWSSVKGPLSSAMATLLDLGWNLLSIEHWEDPDGNTWFLDYNDPLFISMLKEVLMELFSRHIWKSYAANHFAGLGSCPDFAAYFKLKKVFVKQGDLRQLYFLDSVIQGSSVGLADKNIQLNSDNLPTCRHCGQVVTGCPFVHFAYHCSATCSLEHPG